jgi:hypothetical protein
MYLAFVELLVEYEIGYPIIYPAGLRVATYSYPMLDDETLFSYFVD